MKPIAGSILVVAGAVFFLARILLAGMQLGYQANMRFTRISEIAASLCVIVGVLFIASDWIQFLLWKAGAVSKDVVRQAKVEIADNRPNKSE